MASRAVTTGGEPAVLGDPGKAQRLRGTAALILMLFAAGTLAAGCGSSPGSTVRAQLPASISSPGPTASTPVSTATAAAPAPRPRRPANSSHRQSVTRPQIVKPPITWDPIPFGPARRLQMLAYARRHYGLDTYKLIDPHVIVIHSTDTPNFQSTFNTFAPDIPDSELHELPNTCAHFVIGGEGTIHQLVPLDIMCRHTVGLNWTAIGIEHVGYRDQQILRDQRQMTASLRLVHWLRCRFQISVKDVIGHNESLSSPYHHEHVPALRTQTHSDFNYTDMQTYRRRLHAAGGC